MSTTLSETQALLQARARVRRDWRPGFATLLLCGLLATAGSLATIADPGAAKGSMSAQWALVLCAAGYLNVLALIASLAKSRPDVQALRAAAFGQAASSSAVLVGYPVWFLLWKGGLVPEPSHAVLFATVLLVSGVGYLHRRSGS